MRVPLPVLLTYLPVTNILVYARLETHLDSLPHSSVTRIKQVPDESIVRDKPDNLTKAGHLRRGDINLVVGNMNLNSSTTRTRRLDNLDGEAITGTVDTPLLFNRTDHLMSGLTYEDLYADLYDTSDPGYDETQDPFSINFHAYQNQDVIEPWMIDMLRGMYHIRKEEGVQQPLCLNEKLVRMAKLHVKDIVEQELLLSHIGTDGRNSGARIVDTGYRMTSYGASISATKCLDVACALINRPLYYTKQNKYNQLGIAKEEYDVKGDPRWYFVFAGTEEDPCFGMNVSKIDWPEGTPTMAPVPEVVPPPVLPDDGGEMIEDWMIGLLSLLNSERTVEGVGELCFNKKLMFAAQSHNQDQVDNNFMSHYGSNGTTPAMRAIEHGYVQFSYISENVATNQWTVKDTMYAWMSSTGQHGQNIINPIAKHIGLARDEQTGTYTLVFGNYFTEDEVCISTIYCDSTTSFLDDFDPIYSKYSCSLCLTNTPGRQFGVMGCGFGIKWYRDHSAEEYLRRA